MGNDTDLSTLTLLDTRDEHIPNVQCSKERVVATDHDGNLYVLSSKPVTFAEELRLQESLSKWRPNVDVSIQTVTEHEISVVKASKRVPAVSDTECDQLLSELLNKAVELKASDIHLYSYRDDPHIQLRINGECERITLSKTLDQEGIRALCRAIYSANTGNSGSTLNGFQPSKTQSATVTERRGVDGHRYALRYQDAELEGDENTVHVTMRVLELDKDFSSMTLMDLGYESDQDAIIFDLMLKGVGGLVLVVGATGDGKTTTCATALGRLAKETNGRKTIITVEDPVEYRIPGVHHTQVRPEKFNDGKEGERLESTDEAWERHLAALMRRAPDIILQGEMRTPTTAKSAAHGALSGHKTVVTLHGNGVFDAFTRMIELKLPPTLLGSKGFISGVIFQRLMPSLCPHCSHKMSGFRSSRGDYNALVAAGLASDRLVRRLVQDYSAFLDRVRFRNPDGCDHCRLGLKGRIAVAETLVLDDHQRRLIANGNIDEARAQWISQRNADTRTPPDCDRTLEQNYPVGCHAVGFTAFDHAIKKMLYGLISPVDVEDKFGPISQCSVLMDSVIGGDEITALTGMSEGMQEC